MWRVFSNTILIVLFVIIIFIIIEAFLKDSKDNFDILQEEFVKHSLRIYIWFY